MKQLYNERATEVLKLKNEQETRNVVEFKFLYNQGKRKSSRCRFLKIKVACTIIVLELLQMLDFNNLNDMFNLFCYNSTSIILLKKVTIFAIKQKSINLISNRDVPSEILLLAKSKYLTFLCTSEQLTENSFQIVLFG